MEAQVWQVRELLDEDDTIIERWLQGLCNGISQDDGNEDRQDVGNLSRELEADHRRRDCVSDGTGQRSSTCTAHKERAMLVIIKQHLLQTHHLLNLITKAQIHY